jgi:O-antigen ligase
LLLAPIPTRYFERLETIRTYEEIGETSALSRFHFWRVALNMAVDHPFGIGLNNFEYLYDVYDTTDGFYGRARAVHNSFMEVLAEAGFLAAVIWTSLFVTAFMRCWKIRARARSDTLSPADRKFLTTNANALMTSMVGFNVAGSFLAIALNDLTWLTFALVAALDRLSQVMVAEPAQSTVDERSGAAPVLRSATAAGL